MMRLSNGGVRELPGSGSVRRPCRRLRRLRCLLGASPLWWATSWLRWHLPVSREQAQRLAEREAETYYQVLNPKLQFVLAAMERFVRAECLAKMYEQAADESSRRHGLRLEQGTGEAPTAERAELSLVSGGAR